MTTTVFETAARPAVRSPAVRPSDALVDIDRMIDNGRLADAMDALSPLIATTGRHLGDACHLMARACLALGDLDKCAELLALALHHGTGRTRARIRQTRGAYYAMQNRFAQAEPEFRAAAEAARSADPITAGRAIAGLGEIAARRGDLGGAIRHLREADRLKPDDSAIRTSLAEILLQQGAMEDALVVIKTALTADLQDAVMIERIACVLRNLNHFPEAEKLLLLSMRLAPRRTSPSNNLGHLYYGQHRIEEAIAAFERTLRHDPADPVADHMLRSLRGETPAERASEAYVRRTFDDFAADFDDKLVNRLKYRGPQAMLELLQKALPPAAANRRVLDLGCGTGLCGPLLRPFASRLVGVDLSEGMLQRARARACYDDLVQGELVAFMRGCGQTFDVLVAADVLIYIGNLQPVLDAAASVIAPGGTFALSTEFIDGSEGDYRLTSSGRYAHSEAYLRKCIDAAGFELNFIGPELLRFENARPVPSIIATLTRPI